MRGSGGQSSDSVMFVLSEISKKKTESKFCPPPNISRMLLSDIRENRSIDFREY